MQTTNKKIATLNAIKISGLRGGINPLILNLGTRLN